jgi:hypothetical protein
MVYVDCPSLPKPKAGAPKFQDQARATRPAYMHMNPVKCGLVEDPKDWRWNGYSFYHGRGAVLVEMDAVE